MACIECLIVVVTVLYILYKYFTRTHDFWKKKNVAFVQPIPLFGNSWKMFSGQITGKDEIELYYNQLKGHRFGGTFFFSRTVLLVCDPELLKLITTKDFDHFVNRDTDFLNEKLDPVFGKNIFASRDDAWRHRRAIATPAFTSAKMKHMFVLVNECGEELTEFVADSISNNGGEPLFKTEFKDFFSKFTTDIIATTAFGFKLNSHRDPDNKFYTTTRKVMDFTGARFFKTFLMFMAPKLMQKLKIPFFDPEDTQFYMDLVSGTIKHREEQKIVRNDLIQLLMETRVGTVEAREGKPKKELSDDEITAQATVFILAGYETTSTFLSFTAYDLAKEPDVQRRLQEEIDQVVEEEGGVTYDGVMNKMVYLEQVAAESLRMWPPAVAIERVCTKRYVIPPGDKDPGLVLEVGDELILPYTGLHHDPQYFPSPHVFDPDRFSPDNRTKFHPYAYLPFGAGPRNCMGNRYAMMMSKTCLVHLLRKYSFVPTEDTQIPIKLKTRSAMVAAEKGFNLALRPRAL